MKNPPDGRPDELMKNLPATGRETAVRALPATQHDIVVNLFFLGNIRRAHVSVWHFASDIIANGKTAAGKTASGNVPFCPLLGDRMVDCRTS